MPAVFMPIAAVHVGASPRPLAPIEALSQPAVSAQPASRIAVATDAVSISQSGPMTTALIDTVERVALALNVPSGRGRSFNIGMSAVRRGDTVVQQASGPGGQWQFPMGVTALPVDAIGRAMSQTVSSVVASGHLVMSSTTAALRGAQAGDVIDLVDLHGAVQSFVLGYVAADDVVGGAELVMSLEQADQLGATIVTRVLIYGQFSRDQIDAQIAAHGLVDGERVRISRSWAPRNPDSLIGGARVKQLLGEFDYRVNSNDSLTLDADWVANSIFFVNYQSIGVRAWCHRAVIDDIQAALTEVAAAGLSFAIDLGNTNTYGGCWNPRYARVSGSIGSVSRHAWGMALDMNTVANAQGRAPQMDCRVVRIFRRHNFAWGGNFLVPDGMHFEWVGEPRNSIEYPSKYCPNVAGGGIEAGPATTGAGHAGTAPTEGDVMFAGDGWGLEAASHGDT
jgi:D-alanyl-D-alanine carboxypeptidase